MRFAAVTTFHEAGRIAYGDRMVKAFLDRWPIEVDLHVYAEGWWNMSGSCVVHDLIAESDWLKDFKVRHAHRKAPGFRMDAVRFSHKVAALLACDRDVDADYLIWVDADTVTHASVTLEVLSSWVPRNGAWVSWLDRHSAYPECGFYVINRRHARHREMMQRLYAMYADDLLFQEKEWHDSYIMEQIVKQANVPTTSLSGSGYRTHHPFVNGPLGAYMDHMKGKRKALGRSFPWDHQGRRQEEYWK